MDVFRVYTYSTAAWLSLQGLPLLLGPMIEVYFARCLGMGLLTIAVLTVMLTGSIPLNATIAEPVSTEDSDPKAPYALPTLMVTSVLHASSAFYAYTWYATGGQGAFALAVLGNSILAAIVRTSLLARVQLPAASNTLPFFSASPKAASNSPTARTKYTPRFMDSNLQQTPSARALASIESIGETPNLAGQLGSFPQNAQPFASFRNIDNVAARPHLHNSTRTHDTITLENNVHDSSSDDISLLPSADSSFPQSGYEGLAQDPMAASFAGQLQGMRLVPEPPNLEYWRNRLFHVDEMITLSEDEFQTYFPHVDNVYSHRSTQRYKRRPFVSHYWDCRLKGRPPGTPKSDDPNKKKRKRTARERDLCDVKIKITEYLPGAATVDRAGGFESLPADLLPGRHTLFPVQGDQHFGVLAPSPNLAPSPPGTGSRRYYTIQRVNGNGANGKNDGVSGGHRHTLEESDRVKKNSVQRYLLKDKGKKKGSFRVMSAQQKSYHTKATGPAAVTAVNRSAETNLKLYGSCFCPFVQRVWISLELKGIPYQYIEIDPYEKPQSLLEINPRGLVPALQHDDWGCYESSVIMEYLEDLKLGTNLFPLDPKSRAHCRLWADHINRNIVPNFYRVLQEQDPQKQVENAQELQDAFNLLITAAHPSGPYFMGTQISFVDIQAAPWVIRLARVLKPYRGWPDPEGGSRWASWVTAIETNEHVLATTSNDELYLDSYQRYAENRPNTSQVANAINSGRGLP
ncbi:Glutathione S-transferase/chloride channel C-terminal [Penicillium waksmanii]|uniref:Glutathione S-transferase/chloride channel C-terminal n=1 Tax=Penicillium waksmanii TaxID=69791 RepID=UPI0025474C5E|nr:Glutathione S-transferase/chloride channel C-terminal [Penicillium waksmanii]KAJ5983428.1 Glutathione S-transferase/chloride channel C-terminal [Penicillium waksmanii]